MVTLNDNPIKIGRRGRTNLLHASVNGPVTTHPFRDRAPLQEGGGTGAIPAARCPALYPCGSCVNIADLPRSVGSSKVSVIMEWE